MTTNVLDLSAEIAATDSRWSLPIGASSLLYIDNSGCEKIFPVAHLLFVFAGYGGLIQLWKRWAAQLPELTTRIPPCEISGRSVCITLTDMERGRILFEHRQEVFEEQYARFAGTGRHYAYQNWCATGDAIQAVTFAIQQDIYSGGDVKYHRFNGRTNITEQRDMSYAAQKLIQEGRFMTTINPNVTDVPVSEAVKTNPELKTLVDRVVSGEASLISPCDGMYIPWTDDEKQQFSRVITEECNKIRARQV
jgi:hypothetical protein